MRKPAAALVGATLLVFIPTSDLVPPDPILAQATELTHAESSISDTPLCTSQNAVLQSRGFLGISREGVTLLFSVTPRGDCQISQLRIDGQPIAAPETIIRQGEQAQYTVKLKGSIIRGDLTVEVAEQTTRFPVLLSPRDTEHVSVHVSTLTSGVGSGVLSDFRPDNHPE